MRSAPFCAVLLFSVVFAQPTSQNPFATHAKFSADSEADPSTQQPELLHPRLSLSSAVATIARSQSEPKGSEITIVFYSFPFNERDISAARRGETAFLDKRWQATQSHTLKSPEFNGGGRATVELSLDQHFQIQAASLNIPGYVISLRDQDLKELGVEDYSCDGKKLKLKSRGSHRMDLSRAHVPSFTMSWDFDLSTAVTAKATKD